MESGDNFVLLSGFVVAAIAFSIQHSTALAVILITLWVLSVVSAGFVVVLNLRYRRAVSVALEIPIGFRNNPPPPSRKADYLAVERVGIVPYPFDRS